MNIIIYFVGNGEAKRVTRFFELKWWILGIEDEDEYEEAPLTSARKTYQKFFAQDGGPIPSSEAQDGEQNPSSHAQDSSNHMENSFGRGYASGRGQPIPCRWKLLGGSRNMDGSGKNTTRKKKTDGATKAEKSRDCNYSL